MEGDGGEKEGVRALVGRAEGVLSVEVAAGVVTADEEVPNGPIGAEGGY